MAMIRDTKVNFITHKGPAEIKLIKGTFINRNHFM
jgi:hypothetical protein